MRVERTYAPTPINSKTSAPKEQPNNPLHGVKLAALLEVLVEYHGWEGLAVRVNINCFKNDPSIKSSLPFLRKTPWARDKVEALYLELGKKRKLLRQTIKPQD